jgi:Ca2+-binding RTX toxin-like protein
MPLQIIDTNQSGPLTQATLGTTDDAFIAAGITVASTGASAVVGTGSGHFVDVEGTVIALQTAVQLGADPGDFGQHLLIGGHGYVEATGFADPAVSIRGFNSSIDNRGTIHGDQSVVGIGGSDASSTSFINNSGLIAGNGTAIYRLFGTIGTIELENTGTIQAEVGYSYQAGNGNGTAKDIIHNAGLMEGSIQLGGGDDSYDGGDGGVVHGYVDGNDGSDVLHGGAASDVFYGGSGSDLLSGGGGSDDLFGEGEDDEIHGGGDRDIIDGGAGADLIFGDAGDDIIDGGTGADRMAGATGNDLYKVDDAGDVVDETGGSGFDEVESSRSFNLSDSTRARGSLEVLTLTGNAAVSGTGNSLGNLISGNSSANTLNGAGGDDGLYGGGGDDKLIGGNGDDFLYGDTGADRVSGGTGNDVLIGAAGADKFVFDTALNVKTNMDHVTDFQHGVDKLLLDNAVFKALGSAGGLKAGFFFAGKAAHDANDHIIYDRAHGALFYDSDGIGGQAQVAFAGLDHRPLLSAHDFLVI